MKVPAKKLVERAEQLHESNPMLGHRGCRLGITYPEVYEMQVRAIFEAAAQCAARKIDVRPEIMIPLVGTRERVHRAARSASGPSPRRSRRSTRRRSRTSSER